MAAPDGDPGDGAWPPPGWYYGPEDRDAWAYRFDYGPPLPGFGPADALGWVDAAVQLYEWCRANGVRIGRAGRPDETVLHDALLLVDELCRHRPLPAPPRLIRDSDCGVDNDLVCLTVVRDWLRRVACADRRRQQRSSSRRPVAPFYVDLTDRQTPLVVRREGDVVTQQAVIYDVAVYLDALLRADGLWVAGREVGEVLGNPGLRVERIKEKAPEWVKAYIETSRAKGSRLRAELWRNSAEARP